MADDQDGTADQPSIPLPIINDSRGISSVGAAAISVQPVIYFLIP